MCVCVCVCTHTHTYTQRGVHVCVCARAYVYTQTHTHAHPFVCVRTCKHRSHYVCMHAYTLMCVCMHTHLCVYACIHARMCVCIYVYMQTPIARVHAPPHGPTHVRGNLHVAKHGSWFMVYGLGLGQIQTGGAPHSAKQKKSKKKQKTNRPNTNRRRAPLCETGFMV